MPLNVVYRPGGAHHRNQSCIDSLLAHGLEVFQVLIGQKGLWLAVQSVGLRIVCAVSFLGGIHGSEKLRWLSPGTCVCTCT